MIDVLVIGAGIIGSWVALEFSKKGYQVAVCDQTSNGSDGISGRNSGVLHAGIYYSKNSNKALHCVRGKALTIEFAKKHGVDFELCGKLIVADNQLDKNANEKRIEELYHHAIQNEALGIEITNKAKKICSYVKTDLALFSKFTGVIDASSYLKSVQLQAQNHGAIFLWNKYFHNYENPQIELVEKNKTGEILNSEKIQAQIIVNAAGLQCANVAKTLGLCDYTIKPNRGEYYRLNKRLPQDLLIYPLPSQNSTALGVHYTYHCNGDAYVGPNSIPAKNINDYEITMGQKEFYDSLSNILDYYKKSDLSPGYAGLRPRLFYNEEPVKDFVIQKQSDNIIHLLGIESPGLTAAPSLAQHILKMIMI